MFFLILSAMGKTNEKLVAIEKKFAGVSDRVFRWIKIVKLLLLVLLVGAVVYLGVVIYQWVQVITHPPQVDLGKSAVSTYEYTTEWAKDAYEEYAPSATQKGMELRDRAKDKVSEWDAKLDTWLEEDESY